MTQPSVPPAPVEDPWRNWPLLGSLVLAGLQAVGLVSAAVWTVVSLIRDPSAPVATSVALAVAVLAFALLLVVGINALWHGRRWGRGPVLTWQLIQGAAAIGSINIAPPWGVYPVLASSVLVVVGLLLPSSVAATSLPASAPEDTA